MSVMRHRPAYLEGSPVFDHFLRTMTTKPGPSIVRIVRMQFDPERVGDFLSLFNVVAPAIRRFEGCMRLELWRAVDDQGALTTYSRWRCESDLDSYRTSDLFRTTWTRVKPWFTGPPTAITFMTTERLPAH